MSPTLKRLTAASLALALTACESVPLAVQKAADAADGLLVGAEWTICRAATVGSVLRRYGNSPETMDAWRRLCLPDRVDIWTGQVIGQEVAQ